MQKNDRTNVAMTLFFMVFLLSGILFYEYVLHTGLFAIDASITKAVHRQVEQSGIPLYTLCRMLFPFITILSFYLASSSTLTTSQPYRIYVIPLLLCCVPLFVGYVHHLPRYNTYGIPMAFFGSILFGSLFSKAFSTAPAPTGDSPFADVPDKKVNDAMRITFDIVPDQPKHHG